VWRRPNEDKIIIHGEKNKFTITVTEGGPGACEESMLGSSVTKERDKKGTGKRHIIWQKKKLQQRTRSQRTLCIKKRRLQNTKI